MGGTAQKIACLGGMGRQQSARGAGAQIFIQHGVPAGTWEAVLKMGGTVKQWPSRQGGHCLAVAPRRFSSRMMSKAIVGSARQRVYSNAYGGRACCAEGVPAFSPGFPVAAATYPGSRPANAVPAPKELRRTALARDPRQPISLVPARQNTPLPDSWHLSSLSPGGAKSRSRE